jgi:hypothetical protein
MMFRRRLNLHPRDSALVASLLLLLIATPSRLVAAQEKFELVPRLRKGDVHRFSVTLEQVSDQSGPALESVAPDAVPPQRHQTRQTTATTYTFAVDDANEQGATLSIRYDSVAFHATTPDGRVDYDSGNPPGLIPPEVSAMAALVGQGYSVRIDERRNVRQVIGADKLLAAILSKLTLPEGAARMVFEKSLRRQLDDKAIRANLRAVLGSWTDHPVAIGEAWTQKQQPAGGFPITLDSTYSLAESGNGIWTVILQGNITTAPSPAIDMKPMSLSYDLSGTHHGRLQFSSRTGWLTSADISQKLKGSATLHSPNAAAETVPITIATTMKVEQK